VDVPIVNVTAVVPLPVATVEGEKTKVADAGSHATASVTGARVVGVFGVTANVYVAVAPADTVWLGDPVIVSVQSPMDSAIGLAALAMKF
jgi:hypothetical protein